MLFEGLKDVIRNLVCILIRDGLLIKHLHACPVLGMVRERPRISHLLHNVLCSRNFVRLKVLFVKGLLRVYDIAAIRMAGGAIVFEQQLAGVFR